MHFFLVRDIQHLVMYFFPAFLSVFLIGVGLAYTFFRTRGSEEDKDASYHTYPDGIVDKRGPFPLILILVIAGTVIWGFFYVLAMGLLEVRI